MGLREQYLREWGSEIRNVWMEVWFLRQSINDIEKADERREAPEGSKKKKRSEYGEEIMYQMELVVYRRELEDEVAWDNYEKEQEKLNMVRAQGIAILGFLGL